MSGLYFNEIDPFACAVLREAHGGFVDERSIKEVNPNDVRGYERAHFFAGGGLWQIAADMARWPRGRQLWTGSCPCQPLSVAGQRKGHVDERHLWPAFFRLIAECRPTVVVGEQVAGKNGLEWFAGVRADLESVGYACGGANLPACGVGAPHRRYRLYWTAVRLANADGRNSGAERQQLRGEQRLDSPARSHPRAARDAEWPESSMVYADGSGHDGRAENALGRAERRDAAERVDVELGDANGSGLEIGGSERSHDGSQRSAAQRTDVSFWSGAEWLRCADGKARRAPRPESFFRGLADGVSPELDGVDPSRLLVAPFKGRAQAWKVAGNAIVPQVAAQVLGALLDVLESAA